MREILRKVDKEEGNSELILNPIGNLFSEKDYKVKLSVCGDVRCDCGSSIIRISKDGQENIYEIPVNVHDEAFRLDQVDEYRVGEEGKIYVVSMLEDGLSKSDWYKLRDQYYKDKFRLSEYTHTQIEKISYDFAEKYYESESLLFPYKDAFPCSVIRLEKGSEKYLMVDRYCKNPNCGCEKVSLIIYKVVKDKDDRDEIKKIGELVYDYGAQTQEIEEKTGDNLEEIIENFFQTSENIDETFETRNWIIRRLYKESKLRRNKKILKPILRKRIGRNDLCPCGSGIKYKKCCINKKAKL